MNCGSTWYHTVPPLLDWGSFDYGVMYCTVIMVPKRSRDSPSGDFVSQPRGGITCCNYAQSGAALTYETCSPRPNSTTYGLKFYRSVCDAIAYHVFERTSVTFNLTRSYGDFLFPYKLQVALTSFSLLSIRSTVPSGRVMKMLNVVSNVQRPTLPIAARRPFPVFQSGPGWPSSWAFPCFC